MSKSRSAASPRTSPPEAKKLGESDGLLAAQAIALVLTSRYITALYGALTLTSAGLSKIPAGSFFASMAEDARGAAWPWQGPDSYATETREARSAYEDAFKVRFGKALRSEETADGAIRDLVAVLHTRSIAPAGFERLFAWIAAMDRLGQRARVEEERLATERAGELARRRPGRWILPAPRPLGWLERGSANRAYPARIAPAPSGYRAVVANAAGKEIFRATFGSRTEAEQAAGAFVSVRWQISRLPHLLDVDHSLDMSAVWNEPFGADAFAHLSRLADRVDRQARGYGLGDFTDNDAWTRIDSGDVAGLLTRFTTRLFGLSGEAARTPLTSGPEAAARTAELPSKTSGQRHSHSADEDTTAQDPWAAQNAERDSGLFLRAVLYAMASDDASATATSYAGAIGRCVSEGDDKSLLVLLSALTYFVGKVHFLRDDPFDDPAYLPYSRLLAAHFMNAATQCLPGPTAPRDEVRVANARRLAADVSQASMALVEALGIVGASAIESVSAS
jgi:hypothetical protein